MALHVALTHTTTYSYDQPALLGPQTIRLRPAPHSRTPVLSYSLSVKPKEHFINWQQDPFGNYLARVVIPDMTDEFNVVVDVVADMITINPFDFFVEDYAKDWPFAYGDELRQELTPYLAKPEASKRFADYAAQFRAEGDSTIDFLVRINRQVQRDIGYLIRMEPGIQTPEETLIQAKGSCRDSGWLLVNVLRQAGIAARFVSGYSIQLKADQKALDGPSGVEADTADLHAWAEAYVPGAGWVGMDATSGLFTGGGHIPLAATPSPQSAAPISGVLLNPAQANLSFTMTVTRINETPRVTLPYTEHQWHTILKAGDEVDRRLQAGDVRLSMGGEPTFVSIDDLDGAEWNTDAVGPTKRRFAEDLIRRLKRKFAPGGLLHFGQGKWYPGEQLPRWAFALYWRRDGQPLWVDETLIAGEAARGAASVQDAERFANVLAEKLGLPPDTAIPAYEDPAHFLLVEQKLPLNLDPAANKLEDPQERARVVRVFERGLDQPAAYVMPIQAWHSQTQGRRWVTERWKLRRNRLFLSPGESPVGLRLPLGSLFYIAPSDYPNMVPIDPFAPRAPFPPREILLRGQSPLATPPRSETVQRHANEVFGTVRTAMTVEPRDGHLCVFMPPLYDAEDYSALTAAVEETAKVTGLAVNVEGYRPPDDWRFNSIKVTPDPGVIEVNIHPTSTWREAAAVTETLYEEARQARLGSEKFLIDGRHSGTGGGNHIVLGAPVPEDSPFLRRPDLLRSVIAYWQNHPSLSFLFSGLFIGPTSQAPRIDEARNDSLYEMEIAFSQMPGRDAGWIPSWLVDRIFRNLLTDASGNTHRAEICIDKLYSPDSPTGRLGLVEFRAFEMPPHAHMSLAQQHLIRALVAWFWETPYTRKLVPWGTAIHDRFMLPDFLWHDFKEIIQDLSEAGLPIELDWFAPHLAFRFPVYGSVTHEGVTLELRAALEPWHVLGEEGAPGGTVRYVDSSLERVQVKLSSDAAGRYQATCNGFRLPLKPTGTAGEKAAGVRFRAWWPSKCLQPTIPPQTPLVFDLVDTWTGRSVGGCRYHAAHPGGRAYDTVPVNALEAETRRLARFESQGHTPGLVEPCDPGDNPYFPLTLDLRLPSHR